MIKVFFHTIYSPHNFTVFAFSLVLLRRLYLDRVLSTRGDIQSPCLVCMSPSLLVHASCFVLPFQTLQGQGDLGQNTPLFFPSDYAPWQWERAKSIYIFIF
ncbi:hypothetical protein CLU79DRAFT_748179, partial [Phycomyces nitens]